MLGVFQTITKNVLIFKSYVSKNDGGRFLNIPNRKLLYTDLQQYFMLSNEGATTQTFSFF